MKRFFKYSGRFVLFLLVFIILILAGGYFYLNTEKGKVWLRLQISSYLEKTLGTPVSIGQAEFQLPKGVILHNVLVKDHHNDTLVNLSEAEVSYVRYNTFNKKLIFGNVVLNDLKFYLTLYKGERRSNLEKIIDRLMPADTTSSGGGMSVSFKSIKINNSVFLWENQDAGFVKSGIDWDHIYADNINGRFSNLVLGDTISGNIHALKFKEKSGFEIQDLRTTMKYSSTGMEYENLYIKTPETELSNYVKFDYKKPTDLAEFIDSVDFVGHFINSTVSFKDLAFFTDGLINKTDIVKFSGDAKGKVSDLRVDDFEVAFGDTSYARGSGKVRGIPNVDEMYITARLKEARTSRKELMRILPESQLPEEVAVLGVVSGKGNFTGFINDFVSDGRFKTEIGDVVSDINLKLGKTSASSSYSGKIALTNFNLKKLTNQDLLGFVTMNGEVQGAGFDLENIHAKLNANIQRFDFNDYAYHDIKVNGHLSKKFFNGALVANDKNFNLDFKGTVDYNPAKPEFKGTMDVQNANLLALHFVKDSIVLESKFAFDFKGIKPDEIEGVAFAKETKFRLANKSYFFDSLLLSSAIDSNHRSLNIHSNLVVASLEGNFQLTALEDIFKTTANLYIDSTFLRLKGNKVKNQYVNFNVDFKNLDFLFSMLNTDITLEDSGYIKGSINSDNGNVTIQGALPGLTYKDYYFDKLMLKADGQNNTLEVKLDAAGLYQKDSMLLRDMKVVTVSNNDRTRFDIFTADEYFKRQLSLKGDLDIIGKTGYLTFDSSNLVIGDTVWKISSKTIALHALDSLIDVPLLTFANGKQQLKVVGKYGKKEDYPIRVIVEDISLPMLSAFVPELVAFKGDINGQILLNNIKSKPIVEASLFANPLIYKSDTLGILTTTTNYDQSTEKLSVNGGLQSVRTQDELLDVSGFVDFANKQNADLTFRSKEMPLGIFAPVLSGYASDLAGSATAFVRLTGPLSAPSIKGDIDIKEASLKVDYLQTTYRFSHKLTLGGKVINIDDLVVKDVNNHTANVDGKIFLNKIDNIVLQLNINAKDFQVLNTKQEDNSLYFGEAYATGSVKMYGPIDNLNMFLKLKTEKGTAFSLPLGQENTYSTRDYIQYVDKGKVKVQKKGHKLTGLSLNMELEVTPDAYVQIIFDPRVGDIIEANGRGNLKLDVNTEGDFNIYGLYNITKGSYRFTAFDIINKQFTIKEGSSIGWHGNPYEADLNVRALYKVRTSVAPLMEGATGLVGTDNINAKQIVPVEAQLDLRGSLLAPDIKLNFDIAQQSSASSYVPGLDEQIRKIKNDEQALNKQVVSLLVQNSFTPPNTGIETGSAVSSSVGDLITSQFNYLLSKVTTDVQFGVDYRRTENALAPTFRASTDLFNNKVNVNATYDPASSRNATYNVQVTYRLQQDGNTRLKVFNRSSNNPIINSENTNTVGVGIFFRKEFDKFSDLFKKKDKK